MKKNSNYGVQIQPKSYKVNLSIPAGKLYYYGGLDDLATARKAVSMIVETYKKSLELNHPATFHALKAKFDKMFARSSATKVSLKEKIEQNPDYGITECLHGNGPPTYTIQPRICSGVAHFYGSLYDKQEARKAVSMLVEIHLESLKGNSPATEQDLQKKYDETFRGRHAVESFEKKFEAIQNDPNFGVQKKGTVYTVYLNIPAGKKHWYGFHQDPASARSQVLNIAQEYLKSLTHSPATYDDLRQKYGSMKKRSTKLETKLSERNDLFCDQNELHATENNGENGLSVESTEGTRSEEPSLTGTEEECVKSSEEKEAFPNIETTNRNQKNCKHYKVIVSSLQVDENVDFPYADGWRTYLQRGEVFTVSKTKRLARDPNGWNRIRGFCEEQGGWVTLKYIGERLSLAEEVKTIVPCE